jgi:hypothetical protein
MLLASAHWGTVGAGFVMPAAVAEQVSAVAGAAGSRPQAATPTALLLWSTMRSAAPHPGDNRRKGDHLSQPTFRRALVAEHCFRSPLAGYS